MSGVGTIVANTLITQSKTGTAWAAQSERNMAYALVAQDGPTGGGIQLFDNTAPANLTLVSVVEAGGLAHNVLVDNTGGLAS